MWRKNIQKCAWNQLKKKEKNEILEILSEKDILEITIKNAETFFTYNT